MKLIDIIRSNPLVSAEISYFKVGEIKNPGKIRRLFNSSYYSLINCNVSFIVPESKILLNAPFFYLLIP